MKTKQQQYKSSNLDIHQKLKAAKSEISYFLNSTPSDENRTKLLMTSVMGGIEHALYEKNESGFVLVDFFSSYEQASPYAKSILDNSLLLKNSVCFTGFTG